MQTQNLKLLVRGAYDIQKLRIQMGNRIVGNFKVKLGQAPSMKEEKLDAKGKRILKELRVAYKKITDGVKTFPRPKSFKGEGVISTYTELCLVDGYLNLEKDEATHFRHLGAELKHFTLWTDYLEDVKGVGPAMAGVILSEIDITKAKYPSSLWKYAGLDVAKDGAGRSRKKEHLEDREYVNKDGEKATRVGITFNPFLKTKLVGVLGSSFLRCANEPYANIYCAYKTRLENHAVYGLANQEARIAEAKEKGDKYAPKGHRHNMAIRYMIKIFLIDLHTKWRAIEGLPVSVPYSEAKLLLRHGKNAA